MCAMFGKCILARRGLLALAILALPIAALPIVGFVVSSVAAPNAIGLIGAKKDDFQTAAPYAILVDVESGTVLFEKSADVPTPPSSMAKLMTTEVVFNALTQGRIKSDDEFLV